ncbi:MAG: protein of unknown function [Nitrospira sp.]
MQQSDQSIGFGVVELIDERRLFQGWRGLFEDGCLFRRTPLNIVPLMLVESGEPFMESMDIDHGDGERADTTMGTAGSTGERSEQGGLGPPEPAVGPALELS